MAYIYHRNRNESDDHNYQGSGSCQTYESVLAEDSDFTNSGYEFVKWNFQPDGSASDVEPGVPIPAGHTYNIYAIWTPEPKYIVTKSELKSIADAIRAKTGNQNGITFPSGMVSSIDGLPTPYMDIIVTFDNSDISWSDGDNIHTFNVQTAYPDVVIKSSASTELYYRRVYAGGNISNVEWEATDKFRVTIMNSSGSRLQKIYFVSNGTQGVSSSYKHQFRARFNPSLIALTLNES